MFVNNTARWDGVRWDTVSNGISDLNSALIEWKGDLMYGSEPVLISSMVYHDVRKWDGNSFSLFNRQVMFPIRKFMIFNRTLYCSGGQGYILNSSSLVARWDSASSTWKRVGSGIDNTTEGLCAYKGEIYCGGYFNKTNGGSHNYMARLTNNSSIQENSVFSNNVKIYPNPALKIINIAAGTNITQVRLYNMYGGLVKTITFDGSSQHCQLDVEDMDPGIYMVDIVSGQKHCYRTIEIFK
jgi:hypothetical protein